MKRGELNGFGTQIYVSIKEKGILGSEKTSSIECFVCVDCGKVELWAQTPERLRY
jgi:hypothetical protein